MVWGFWENPRPRLGPLGLVRSRPGPNRSGTELPQHYNGAALTLEAWASTHRLSNTYLFNHEQLLKNHISDSYIGGQVAEAFLATITVTSTHAGALSTQWAKGGDTLLCHFQSIP